MQQSHRWPIDLYFNNETSDLSAQELSQMRCAVLRVFCIIISPIFFFMFFFCSRFRGFIDAAKQCIWIRSTVIYSLFKSRAVSVWTINIFANKIKLVSVSCERRNNGEPIRPDWTKGAKLCRRQTENVVIMFVSWLYILSDMSTHNGAPSQRSNGGQWYLQFHN